MSTTNVSPMKGDIVLTRKGHRRLWDGRHWRVLCRIPYCQAQRQGSLYNKFGLCKKHFSQMKIFLCSNSEQINTEKKKTAKRRNLNVIIEQLRQQSERVST